MITGTGPPGIKVGEGKCPPLYAEGLCIRAFGGAYFVKHFEWLLRRDLDLGRDSYGQNVRLYIEHCYIMRKDLDDLMDGGWKHKQEFKT